MNDALWKKKKIMFIYAVRENNQEKKVMFIYAVRENNQELRSLLFALSSDTGDSVPVLSW